MPRLPILPGELQTGGNGENLFVYLSEVNDPGIVERIGRERVIDESGLLSTTKGKVYTLGEKKVVGLRFLRRNEQNEIIGVANITCMDRQAVVSNIYVRRDYRRQGVATELVEYAKKRFPKLMVDHSLTDMGALFFGYPKALASAPDDMKNVAAWLHCEPRDMVIQRGYINLIAIKSQIEECLISYEAFPDERARMEVILGDLKQGAPRYPLFIEKGDPSLFVMEGRHRMVALYVMGVPQVEVAYVSRKPGLEPIRASEAKPISP